jgi:hypothetical protein
MIDDVLSKSGGVISENVLSQLRRGWRGRFRSRSAFLRGLKQLSNPWEKVAYLLKQILRLSESGWAFILSNLGLYKSGNKNFVIPLLEWVSNGGMPRSSRRAVQDACGGWFLKEGSTYRKRHSFERQWKANLQGKF